VYKLVLLESTGVVISLVKVVPRLALNVTLLNHCAPSVTHRAFSRIQMLRRFLVTVSVPLAHMRIRQQCSVKRVFTHATPAQVLVNV
jgi:hypothetical protein